MSGLYVASNVQSMVAQTQIQRNIGALGDILTRLSTGLRINSGKDDPAGLIASELLKSDITGTNMAIRNTQRANSIIAIADSALGQVSNLLNDIKALVVEAANTGAMNKEQIAANQLQVDATIDSIDRIAKTTSYQGQLLLDGSMGFNTAGVSRAAVKDLNIHQANFGTQTSIDISIDVAQDASRAQLFFDKSGVSERAVIEVTGNRGSEVFNFHAGASVSDMARAINQVTDSTGVRAVVGQDATYGQLMATSAGFNNDINFRALVAGYAGGNYTIKYVAGSTNETTYTITPPTATEPGIIEFQLQMEPWGNAEVKGLDEAYNGIHTAALVRAGGDPDDGLIVQSDNGTVIRSFSIVETTLAAVEPSVNFDPKTGHLQILANAGTTNAQLADVINRIDGLTVVQEGSVDLVGTAAIPLTYQTTIDVRANNALDILANTPGSKFENTDVVYLQGSAIGFSYSDFAQKAGVTVANVNGVDADQFLRLTAKVGGSEFNEVGIAFDGGTGPMTVVYDEEAKMIRVFGGTGSATLGDLKRAIEKVSPFMVDAYTRTGTDPMAPADLSTVMNFGTVPIGALRADDINNGASYSAVVRTGQIASDLGTDNQALIITVGATSTADQVVQAFKTHPLSHMFTIANATDSDGSGRIFWNGIGAPNYLDPASFVFTAALKGGTQGFETAVTAAELVDFVNNDAVLSQILHADLALNSPTGTGKLTLFEEYAYYGDPNAGTGLQFLGPKDSPDIIFASNLLSNGTKVPNQPLGIYFLDDTPGNARIDIPAKNANAAITITANGKGEKYDDMIVRYFRLGNDHVEAQSYVRYDEGPSSAMAYCSILDNAANGTSAERGKFIVFANDRGEMYNNVNVVARLDVNQSESATAYFDHATKQLIVTVNNGDVSLSDAICAINNEGTFSAEYDFTFNHDTGSTGPANADFLTLLGTTTGTSKIIGNTGETGGHTGGVLNVYLAGDDKIEDDPGPPPVMIPNPALSANAVVSLINNDAAVKHLFTATNYGYGGSQSDGTGLISFRIDNLKEVTDAYGKTSIVPTATSLGGVAQKGSMVIQLATDQYGNFTTTAKQLVDFFDTLTAEQTRGISVSVVKPVGVDNLNRTWTVDSCGNVIMSQPCDDEWGNGVLNPKFEFDDCEELIYEVLRFHSYGSNIQNSRANDDVITVNGWESMFNIQAKFAGPQYEGVSLVYEQIADPNEPVSARYDEFSKQIIVRVFGGDTTAAEVKAAIESGETTRDLFNVTLKSTGSAPVTLSDDALNTQHGTYEAGYRGGARMYGAADADPHRLTFESVDEGSTQRVSVRTLDGDFNVRDVNGKTVDTAYGTDMIARINGIAMQSNGRALSVDTAMLKLNIVLDEIVGTGNSVKFSITGGGATFQIGPDVTSNQQIRLGLPNVNSARLGGASGRLFMIRSGGIADLSTNTKLADLIVQEAILSIAQTRGRLGAIQRSTLEPTIITLQDTVEQLSAAEAQISNADFAEESSKLMRAQILVQSGARTLAIANQFPQYAASLIG